MASPQLTTTFLLLVLSSVIATSGASDLESDRAALLTFLDAFPLPLHRLRWNETPSPCDWWGVSCASGEVDNLTLPAIGLVGSIPAGSLGRLTGLQTLSLPHNSLSGPLPSDFIGAYILKVLDLQNNSLSGEIPRYFDQRSLERLNLEYNNFSGELPNINLPILRQFNVSYNNLTGVIPRGFQSFPASSFLGMPLCGGSVCTDGISPAEDPAPAPHGSPDPAPHGSPDPAPYPHPDPVWSRPDPAPHGPGPGRKTAKLSGGVIAGLVIAAVVAVTVVIVILYFMLFVFCKYKF